MSNTKKGIAIYPDKRVEEVEVFLLEDYQAIVNGYIEAVGLKSGDTMYVNEEYWYRFGPTDLNSIAMDVAGLGGRPDLMLNGILGPVVVLGPLDDEGNDTDISDQARRWIKRVAREAA